MDKISAYAAYGIKKKANQKVTKNRVKRRQMTRPNNRKFNQKKNQLIKKFANNLKSAGGKISGSNNLKGFEIIPKQINGAAAINKQIKKSAGGKISGSNNLKGFKNIPKQINGAAAIKKQIKNPKIKSMAHDSSDEEHSLNEGSDLSFCSSGDEEFDEYTLNESSFSSQESSPVAVAAAAAVIPRASTNAKRTNGDLNNNNKNKNSNKNAKSSAAQQQKEKAGPPKKTQRQSTAAPSCPLPRQPGKAGAIKSGPLPSKTAAQRRKSLPLPNKMAANVKAMTVVKQEPNVEMEQVDTVIDSVEQGKTVLSWLINPMTPDKFFTDYWETKACQVKRKRANYYSDLVSFKMIDEMLIENHLEFTTNIDLTTYKNGVRETLNVTGRAIPPNVWGHYAEGCSVRILNPSTYLPGLRNVCTALQEHFHCLVGANIYLTPPNSQGFAPHYDDIEAFVLQVEGRKRWRLYAAPSPNEELARTSSGNLKQQQLSKPIYDEVLEPGDLLYFPRGTVHQAVTEQKQHSLHITLSVYQQQAYANLMETLMPIVIQNAIKENLNLRRGLPLSTWNHLGYVNSDKKTPERNEMIMATKKLVSKYLVPTVSQIDNAIDQLAMRYQHEALPPNITPSEKKRTIFGSRTKVDKQGNSLCDYEMTGKTKIRLLRKNVLRLVNQEAGLRLYFYVDNALEYCKFEANFIEIEQAEANAIKMLVNSYPKYITIDNLPLPDVDQCIEIVTGLWERGLLITEEPFNKH